MIIPRKELPAGTILRENSCVRVTGFSKLPENNRNSLHLIIKAYGLEPHIIYDGEDIEFPDCGLPLGKVGRAVKYGDLDLNTLRSRASRKRIKFAEIDEKSKEGGFNL